MITEIRKRIADKIETLSSIQKSGIILITATICSALIIFSPIILKELSYWINRPNKEIVVLGAGELKKYSNKEQLVEKVRSGEVELPLDEDFGIIIPKLGINTKVLANIDPYNSKEYQVALSQGVAHAKGTGLPNEMGNTFIFAHSSDNIYNANKYNSVFYLLHHLDIGDNFYISYSKKVYKYEVEEKKVINPNQLEYMKPYKEIDKAATLMTCWPAGTTLNRMVIVGKQVD